MPTWRCVVSQAIAALPDDGSWIPARALAARSFAPAPRPRAKKRGDQRSRSRRRWRTTLRERELIEMRGGKVRRRGRHFVAQSTEERQALGARVLRAVCQGPARQAGAARPRHRDVSAQPLLEHRPGALPEFHKRLDELARLAEEFAADAAATTRFLNVLVTATPF